MMSEEAPVTTRTRGASRMHAIVLTGLALLAVITACGRPATGGDPREYAIRGQILGLRRDVGEVRLKHDAIPGFMGAMTMSFGVKDRTLLDGRQVGDLVTGTLVVTGSDAWLSALDKVGFAAVTPDVEERAAPAPAFSLLDAGDAVPDETFIDQAGRPWQPSALKGKAWALTFIYTRCPLPTYCPMMDRHFRAAQRAVSGDRALADSVRFVTVSFDPDYDTPAVLARHAAALGADLATWSFVTADREQVEAFAAKFGLSVMRNDKDPLDITHNLRTAVVGPSGTIVAIRSGADWTPSDLVAELEAAAGR
jgi:protein SCO1/2